ncbi:Glutamine-dependent NAD(+) synthetase [Limihaloglobus sulfuriphilus]|uniref:Glutamine-dependent NAD(+) synthetase n=1 Tax=Limihaloglobus sulfuriphilus TaxID=1851148 RepID=A0A1Q2MBW6_9BACT|nr:NAD+ synthase [Limihaloglobus sulfuriphilus]AQQ70028.1 Glutamine-dependent NAD(+) synthetase [Limihaloglobus sulfuriphilus]
MKIALIQINPIVGDFEYNLDKISSAYSKAVELGAELTVFPELALSGYPPEDLLLKPHFTDSAYAALRKLAASVIQVPAVVGFPSKKEGGCYNSLALLAHGDIAEVYDKHVLPNYGVFDERRYFKSGSKAVSAEINGFSVAFTICEDIWQLDEIAGHLEALPHPDLILNISASPFHKGKIEQRKQILANAARTLGSPLAYCNLVGGQDELVFDGRSMFVDTDGKVVTKAAAFDEDICIADLTRDGLTAVTPRAAQPEDVSLEVFHAVTTGTRDYIRKNGFKKAVVGLSGGIDSAVVAAVAAEALGPENVIGVTMPSQFNSAQTRSDAKVLADNLGIAFHTIPIGDTLNSFHTELLQIDGWNDKTTAYENLQARIRGTLLMSLSNQFGWLVLTTGNKSETAVGYSTLYGDTAGGFAVIKDVPKTLVYKIARRFNELKGREIIPESTITRPPSAELRTDQKDSDSLPDYDLLDGIIEGYVEKDMSAAELVNAGFDAELVQRVIRLVDMNEYKRRQCPPGVKITPKAFGRDRRMPITNRYKTRI